MAADTDKQSFWDHLDALRSAIVKSLLAAAVFGAAAFCFKEAPSSPARPMRSAAW